MIECHGGKCARFLVIGLRIFCARFADFCARFADFLRSVCGFFALGLRIFCARFADFLRPVCGFFALGLRIFRARFADFLRSVCGFFALGLRIFCARFADFLRSVCYMHGYRYCMHGPPSLDLSCVNYKDPDLSCMSCIYIRIEHCCMHGCE